MEWLHTDGIYVKDPQGRIIALRQIGQLSWRDFNQQFITNAKAHGLNCILAFLIWKGFEGSDPEHFMFDPANPIDWALLDSKVALCKSNGIYLQLGYLMSTTELAGFGISGEPAVSNHLIEKWTPVIERYKNEPAVVGCRIIDEPHTTYTQDRDMYNRAINALRQINPNCLWFTHVHHTYIFINQYGTPYWSSNEDLATCFPSWTYHNIIIDGAAWIKPYYESGDLYYVPDYATADSMVAMIMSHMKTYRDSSQIPTGCVAMYMWGYYPTTSVPWIGYCLRELYREMEQGRYMICHYIANWQCNWAGTNEDDCFNEIFQDTPYPSYWDSTPSLNASIGGPYFALPTTPAITLNGVISGGTPPYSWTINWGDGSTSETGTEATITRNHTYPTTDNVQYPITLTATDSLNAQVVKNTTATITSTPPTPQIPVWIIALPIIGGIIYFLWKKH